MAEEPLVIVRAAVDAFNRRDWSAVFAAATDDFEYDLSRTDSPMRGVYRGREEISRLIADFYEPWDEVRCEPHDLMAEGETVVMPYTNHFRGRDGLAVTARATWVWTIRGGAIARLCLYQELEEALAAARAC